jgi:hypothetical protein
VDSGMFASADATDQLQLLDNCHGQILCGQ